MYIKILCHFFSFLFSFFFAVEFYKFFIFWILMPYQLCNLQIFYSVGCLFLFYFWWFPLLCRSSLFLWRRKWQPTPVLLPGKSRGQSSLIGNSPPGRKELDTTERLHLTSPLLCRSFLVWCSWLMYILFYWFAFGVRAKKKNCQDQCQGAHSLEAWFQVLYSNLQSILSWFPCVM